MFQQMQIAHTTRWQQQQRLRCNCNIDWGIDGNQLVSCFAGHWVNSLNINHQLSYFIDKLCADYRDTDRVAYTCPCMYRAVSINSNGACGPRSHTQTHTHTYSSAQLCSASHQVGIDSAGSLCAAQILKSLSVFCLTVCLSVCRETTTRERRLHSSAAPSSRPYSALTRPLVEYQRQRH